MLPDEGSAIEVVFELHFQRLERHLTRILRDPDEARDLASEAFVRLTREVADGRAPRNPPAWLHRVGANLARSRGRHLSVADRLLYEVPRGPEPDSPEALTLMRETCGEVAQVLSGLSPSERAALCLAASGYGSAAIGVALGRTPGAVRTMLCRARAKLRSRMSAL